jgi:hypothetical protein
VERPTVKAEPIASISASIPSRSRMRARARVLAGGTSSMPIAEDGARERTNRTLVSGEGRGGICGGSRQRVSKASSTFSDLSL